MNYQSFLFSQLFINHIQTTENIYNNLSYDLLYSEVLNHLDQFICSSFNVDARSEYDCMTSYLLNNI